MEITKDLKRQIVDHLHQECRTLAAKMGSAVDVGVGTASGVALRSPNDPKMAVYIFMASGPFTDDDLRAVRDAHMKVVQDMALGTAADVEVRTMKDNLNPASDES